MKELEFTFESDALAGLFVERLKFYLDVDGVHAGTRVSVKIVDDEKKISDIERLARGSYASFSASR